MSGDVWFCCCTISLGEVAQFFIRIINSQYITIISCHVVTMCTPQVTQEILRKVDRDGKLTYTHENYLFHYIASDMITYLCIADEVSPNALIHNSFA